MTEQIICDECGRVIDLGVPHYQLNGQKVRLNVNGVLEALEQAQTLHYHEEHLPVYKIEGAAVEGLPGAVSKPPVKEDQTDAVPVGPPPIEEEPEEPEAEEPPE